MTFESDAIEAGGRRIAFRRAGSGPPLLFLHGLLADSRIWQPQIDALSDDFNVVAWDAPGCGGSEDPPEDIGLAGYADALAAFVEALSLERPAVCGLSFGGALALEFGARHPALSSRIVSAGGYAGWAGSLPSEEVRARLERSLAMADVPAGPAAREFVSALFSDSAPADLVDSAARIGQDFRPAGVRAIVGAMAAADLRDELARLSQPALVVHGEEDRRATRAVADALHAAIPSCQLVVIPGAGHMTNLEAPEAFNDALRRFLATPG